MGFVFRRLAVLTAAAGCLILASCGGRYESIPETGATLEGTVTYGKEPLQAALIIVAGANGSAQGNIGEDGRYKVENVPLGEVSIAVNTAAAKGEAIGKAMAQSQGKAKAAPKIIDVPAKYANPKSSGIKTTINKGKNTYDIVIPK